MWIRAIKPTMEFTSSSTTTQLWLTLLVSLIVFAQTCTSIPTLRPDPSSKDPAALEDEDIWGPNDDAPTTARTTRIQQGRARTDTDVLSRLEDRLRSMDAANAAAVNTARSDYVLERLSRRLESIESKLTRLEIKFDVRLEKVEEVVMGKEIKEEFASDQLSRQIENLGDKVANKLGFLEAKMGLRIDNLSSRLDRSERQLQGTLDDVLEKMVKTDDKQIQSEARIWSRMDRMEDATSGVQDLRTYVREELGGFMSKRLHEISHKIEKGFEEAKDAAERRHGAVEELGDTLAGVRTTVDDLLQRIEEGSANHTCDRRARVKSGTTASAPEDDAESYSLHPDGAHPKMELFTLQTSAKLSNLTSSVAEAMQFGEKKFKELDRDVEVYTRKVLNAYQDVLKGTTKLEAFLSSALSQGNQTRVVIQDGFRKLSQQLQPITDLAPKMDEMTKEFEKRMEELSTIVDERFASLLVSQNTFIASCHRIQAQEPQFEKRIGDMLQEVKEDVQSRLATSASDTRFLRTALNNHNVQIGKALNDLVWTLLSVGNQTKADLRGIAVQVSTMQQLPRGSRHAVDAPITAASPASTNGDSQCSCLINPGDWGTLSQACSAIKGKGKGANQLPKEPQELGQQKVADGQRPHRRHQKFHKLPTTTTTTTQKPVQHQKYQFDSEMPLHDQAPRSASEELDATMLPPLLEDLQLAHILQRMKVGDADGDESASSSLTEHDSENKRTQEQGHRLASQGYNGKPFTLPTDTHQKQSYSATRHKSVDHLDYSDPADGRNPSEKLSETRRGELHPSISQTASRIANDDNDKKTSTEYDYEDDYSDDYEK